MFGQYASKRKGDFLWRGALQSARKELSREDALYY